MASSSEMPNEHITIEIPIKQATHQHIESPQAALTKRNEQIQRLEQRVAEAEAGEPNQARLAREFERGWKACANHLLSTTDDAARALRKVRKDALDIYYRHKEEE